MWPIRSRAGGKALVASPLKKIAASVNRVREKLREKKKMLIATHLIDLDLDPE